MLAIFPALLQHANNWGVAARDLREIWDLANSRMSEVAAHVRRCETDGHRGIRPGMYVAVIGENLCSIWP